ncbi:MAG: hypothetical protein FWB90_10080 [Fibromonadales bacterium]|nr:hypothetical protein [Fibromonadales bacterium]
MNATQTAQVYRTICIPQDSRFDIPIEYVGREIEITIIPAFGEEYQLDAETLEAMQEVKDIESGKIQAKRYNSAAEMHADILAEEDK